jgi:hypothetical protein
MRAVTYHSGNFTREMLEYAKELVPQDEIVKIVP